MIRYYLMQFLAWCPGAIGIVLRQKFYPYLFGFCGQKVLIGRYVRFDNPFAVSLGDNCIINDHTSFHSQLLEDRFSIVIEPGVFIGSNTDIRTNGERILLKSGCNIGSNCKLVSDKPLIVEENVLLAAYCELGIRRGDLEEACANVTQESLQTVIGNGCWLGVRTKVKPGVHIHGECVIGAHSYVNKDIRSFSIAYGQPASIVGARNI